MLLIDEERMRLHIFHTSISNIHLVVQVVIGVNNELVVLKVALQDFTK